MRIRHVARAGSVAKYTNADARKLWADVHAEVHRQHRGIIEADRASGGAHRTILPARDLATSLNLMNERA